MNSKILRLKFLKNTNKTSDIITYNALEILGSVFNDDFQLHLLGPYKDAIYGTVVNKTEPIDVIGVYSGSESTYFGTLKQHFIIEKNITIKDVEIRYRLFEIRNFFKTISNPINYDEIAFTYSPSTNMYHIDHYGLLILKIRDTLEDKYLQFNYTLKKTSESILKQLLKNDVNLSYDEIYKGFLNAYLFFMIQTSGSIYFPVLDNDVLIEIKYQKISLDELKEGAKVILDNLRKYKMLDTEIKNDTLYKKIDEVCINITKDIIQEKIKG